MARRQHEVGSTNYPRLELATVVADILSGSVSTELAGARGIESTPGRS